MMIGSVGLFDQKLGTAALGGKPSPLGSSALAPGDAAGASFGELLAAAANRTADTLHNAEAMAVKGLQGGADTREVVDAVMSAEQSLQAAIAIRDKIVAAYLDISRMAI